MCLSSVTEKFQFQRMNSKPFIGYKVARAYKERGKERVFGPLYCNRPHRWNIGKSYRARYDSISIWHGPKGLQVNRFNGMYSKIITRLREGSLVPRGVKPKIKSRRIGVRDMTYECGFHYFTTRYTSTHGITMIC